MSAASCPGSPDAVTALSPGVIPTRAEETFATGAARISSPLTAVMAPVTFTFFWVANAVTTVSSSKVESSRSTMRYFSLFPTVIVWSAKPMQATVNASPAISKLNCPSRSVIVPFWVPTSRTVAPITGMPLSSTTVPDTVLVFCAAAGKVNANRDSTTENDLAILQNRV